MWRVSTGEPSGLHIWFDPETEVVRLYSREPQPEDGVGVGREGSDPDDLYEDFPSKSLPGVQGDLPF